MAEAIDAAYESYGCHIITISMAKGYDEPLKTAVREFHNGGGLLVATFDNKDRESIIYPACFRNDWVLCAQGSSRHPVDEYDTTPERRVSSEDPLYDWGADWPHAYWPIPLLSTDVSAPASHMCLVYADSFVVAGVGEKKPYYSCGGSGVSMAPPQVAGIAALMLSTDNALTVDDLEGLISASCTDITSDDNDGYETPGSLPGWDKFTGWGRVNADSCMYFLEPDHPCDFSIQHFTADGGGTVTDSGGIEVTWFVGGDGPLPDDYYNAKRFEVRRAIAPPAGYKFVWGRPCSTAGWGWTGRSPIVDWHNYQEPYCGLVPSTQHATSCTLFSYTYKVWKDSLLGWFPAPPDSLDWAYGVLYQGTPASVSGPTANTFDVGVEIIGLAPNPGDKEISISFELGVSCRAAVRIYDVRGREVREVFEGDLSAGIHNRIWDGLNNEGTPVAPGLYLCRVNTGHEYDIRKIILLDKGGN